MAYRVASEFSPNAVAAGWDVASTRLLKAPNDRFCVQCGFVIRGQAMDKPAVCPHKNCKQPLIFRANQFDSASKWGRCRQCDSFTHADFPYCQSCGTANRDALSRKRRFEQIQIQKQQLEAKRLKEENDALKQQTHDPDFLLWKEVKKEEERKRILEEEKKKIEEEEANADAEQVAAAKKLEESLLQDDEEMKE